MKYCSLLFCVLILNVCSVIAQNPANALLLQSGTLYPENNLDAFINEPLNQSEVVDGYIYRIIQFENFPDENLKKEIISSGIKLNMYLPYHAYGCALPVTLNRFLLKTLHAHAVLRWDASFKTQRLLNGPDFPAHTIIQPGHADLVVHYQPDLSDVRARQLIEQNNFIIVDALASIHTFTVRIAFGDLHRLIALPFVFYVEPIAPPSKKDDTQGRSLHRSNYINSDFVTGKHYDGSGVVIALADDGEIGPHIDFKGRITQHLTGLGGSHGDMTSGICMGAGNLNSKFRGMGTGAYLHVYDIANYTHIVNAVSNFDSLGSVITSTSYSQGCNEYTANTQFGDNMVHDNPQLSLVFSAGNDGENDCGYGAGVDWGNITGGYKVGKNVIACGNLNAGDILENSSSRGPAPDGRIKPDICSNGINQMSTAENNTYQVGGGTSAACPGVAGVFSQLYQAYKEINTSANPDAALIKACVLNSAEDLGNSGPDYKHGWGRINAFRALTCLEQHNYFYDSVAQGQLKTHVINVPAGVRQLRVMTYWTDEAGIPNAAKSLVNDIDMIVSNAGTGNISPWTLNPAPNAATLNQPAVRGRDSLNNVEQVTINDPAAGNYTVEITGNQIPLSTQNYYVVYEFRTDSVVLTYPNGGEGFLPGETEMIRWDAYDTVGTFELSYSLDNGTNWNVISSSISGDQRLYGWGIAPNITAGDKALMKITRNGFSDVNDTFFTIFKRPANFHVTFVCPDSIGLAWNTVANTSGYAVYMLGAKYMDEIATTTSTNYTVTGTNPLSENWFSVRSIGPNGGKSRRADAIKSPSNVTNCLLSLDGGITQVTSPLGGIASSCLDHSNMPVKIVISNPGLSSISGFTLSYSLDNNSPLTESYSGSIAAAASDTFTFAQNLSIASPGNFTLKVWITISGDLNEFNDTAIVELSILSNNISLVPAMENFDSQTLCSTASVCGNTNCTMTSDWQNLSNGNADDIDWIVNRGATPTVSTGPDLDHTTGLATGRYIYLEASGNCNGMEADLISPCFDLTNVASPMLTFWYHMFGTAMGSLHVDVIGESQTINDIIPARSGDQGNSWKKDSVSLSQFSGEKILVRFRGITGTGNESDMALDDISMLDVSTGISNIDDIGMTNIYPNPSTGIFNFVINGTKPVKSIIIRDALGKRILEILPEENNVQSGTIDLSKFQSGVYTCTLTNGNSYRQIRLMNFSK